MLMMSELARGLFKRCIAQSGTANLPGFLFTQKRAGKYVRKMLAKTGGLTVFTFFSCILRFLVKTILVT